MIKDELDKLILKHKIQPVGCGYIDCIVTFENVFNFINDLTDLGIKVNTLTWWCHCKDKKNGCPHGIGGPVSKHYDGWFSEMWFKTPEFDNNKQKK